MQVGCVVLSIQQLEWAKECNFDYLELKGDFLLKLFRAGTTKQILASSSIPIIAMTSPLPREFGATIIGQDANHKFALEVFTLMADHAAEIGIETIVFGCGQARSIPKYFNRNRAYDQFLSFINKAKSVCNDRKQVLTIEPLHRGETNFINSCREAQKVIDDVPGLSITADCYHIFTENLKITSEIRNSGISHSHTSYLPRGSGMLLEEFQKEFMTEAEAVGCCQISIEENFTRKETMEAMLSQLRHMQNH